MSETKRVKSPGEHTQEEWGRYLAFRDAYLALCREHGFYLASCGCCGGTNFLTDELEFQQVTAYFLDGSAPSV